MQLSKTRVFLYASGLLVLGAALGALGQQKWATYTGGIYSEVNIVEAGQALDRNDLARAESLALDAIPLDPESHLPYQMLGEIYSRRHETAAAITAYSRAEERLRGQRGHYRVLQLTPSMRQTDLMLLNEKIEKLKNEKQE
jgi:Tfp pilus assembly protein PilF